LGHVASYQIAAIDLTEGVKLAAACDIHPDCAMQLPDSVEFHSSFEKLLSAEQCDVVMIATPNREHYRLGRLAIDAGKALVLEKPAVESRRQFDDIVNAATSSDIFLHIAMHAAFGAEVLWLARQLESDSLNLGEIRGFRSSFRDPYIAQNRLTNGAASLGGSWMDSGVNALSVLGNFIDLQDLRVSGSRMRAFDGLNCSETEGLVKLESDTVRGEIHTSWLTGVNHKSTRLLFEQGEILLDHSLQSAFIGAKESRQVVYSYDGPLHRLTNHYVGVFTDLVRQYSISQGNADIATPIHRIFFEADEVRQELDRSVSRRQFQ
jgi:predicted dehydrogenase